MSGTFVSGTWVVREGDEPAFAEAWARFLDWSHDEVVGLHWALLLRDGKDPRHFVSVAEWDTAAHRDAWRVHPDFPAHFGPCRALCEDFRGADYELEAAVTGDRRPETQPTSMREDRP
jgi:heme-degrading monooxygenase HmoA